MRLQLDSAWIVPGIVAAALLVTTSAAAQRLPGDPAAGQDKAQACIACHGEDGNSQNPAWPRIGGQYADYLYHSLKAYKSGDRQNAVMAGQVANLSDQDLRDLASFYATQDGPLDTVER